MCALVLLAAASSSAEPERCRLRASLKVFVDGAWVEVESGALLLLGERGEQFTKVASKQGVGRAANTLIDARCRAGDVPAASRTLAPTIAPLDVYRPRPCARGQREDGCMRSQWQRGRALLDQGDLDGAWAAFAQLDALSLEARDRRTEAFGAGLRRARLATLRALPDPGATPAQGPRALDTTVRIAAVGDVHLGRGNARPAAVVPPDNGRHYFDEVAPLLRGADLAFGNLETALVDSGESDKCERSGLPEQCHAFRAPTGLAPALAAAGFDVLSVENNHATDFGTRGMLTTTAALVDAGIAPAGAGHIATLERNGARVAFAAFAPYRGALDVRDLEIARRTVAWLAHTHHIVVVSFHAGAEGPEARHVPKAAEEFYGEPRGDVHAFAHAVVDAGADLVLGHGPHVLRAMERYRGRLIAYSLGNFSSYRTFDVRGFGGESAVLEVELAGDGALVSARLHPVRLGSDGRPAPDSTLGAFQTVRALSREDLGEALFDENGRWPGSAGSSARAVSAPQR
ncbi:MAG: CapA family protein [Deltaproteobacteria bacterium]|nr:CapA family protein [Deltaproteobacteria bacterium]